MAIPSNKPLLRDLPQQIATPDLPGATPTSQKRRPTESPDEERETRPAAQS